VAAILVLVLILITFAICFFVVVVVVVVPRLFTHYVPVQLRVFCRFVGYFSNTEE